MKVILLKNVSGTGTAGEVREVADGYARNFLFPRGMAGFATAEALRRLQQESLKKVSKEKENFETVRELASKINNLKIIIKAKAKDGKLFGSVGAKEIAGVLKNQGIEIKEEAIILDEPIRKTGEKKITLKLNRGIETTIKVTVAGE
jgi:large subunit ribosomal protein L9